MYIDKTYKNKLSTAGYEKAKNMFENGTQINKLFKIITEMNV